MRIEYAKLALERILEIAEFRFPDAPERARTCACWPMPQGSASGEPCVRVNRPSFWQIAFIPAPRVCRTPSNATGLRLGVQGPAVAVGRLSSHCSKP